MNEIKLKTARRLIESMKQAAIAADQGLWHRSHSQVISISSAPEYETNMVALMEFYPDLLKEHCGWKHDPLKDMPNTRHVVASCPKKLLLLLDTLEELYPELKKEKKSD